MVNEQGFAYVFDALGNRVASTNLSSGWETDYVYAGSTLVHRNDADANGFGFESGFGVYYGKNSSNFYKNYSDQVGTERVQTQYSTSGSTVNETCQNLPFGDGFPCQHPQGGYGGDVYYFAGLFTDPIGTDNQAVAREYSGTQGRWESPDPAGLAAVDPSNPQTWNRYAYVTNNPLSFTDPLGLNVDETGCHEDASTACVTGGGDVVDVWVTCVAFCFGGPGIPGGPSPGPVGGGGSGPANPANNGRNCTSGPASAGQYVAATAQVAAMTSEFFSGLGPGNLTFGPGSSTSQVMAQSGPVQDVLNSYYMTGQTSGLYTFGGSGYVAAGGNPVAQFVGSFRWSIAPGNGGINLSLTNTTSFRSLTYDMGPQWQRGSFPTPMGNTHQTYNITAKCQ